MTEHPFVAAWRTRDLEAWSRQLAADVTLSSPLLTKPIEGRQTAIELYRVLFEQLGPVTIAFQARSNRGDVFWWRCQAGGRDIEGADWLRYDDRGKVTEIRVMIRPLPALAAFAAAVGPPMAAQHSRGRALAIRVLSGPLKVLFGSADRVATRLLLPDGGAPGPTG